MSEPTRIPVFRVRFESYDDFLVEYGEHLRRGYLMLPLQEGLGSGASIRIKLTLPDSQTLFMTGVAEEQSVMDTMSSAPGVRVRLSGLTAEQRQALERCVAAAAAQVEALPVAQSNEPIHLLLVDDSVSARIELGDALRDRGVKVRVAENGLTAIAAALKRPPDVILSDVEMPTMDGWTLLRMVRSRKRLMAVPFVFHTKLDDDLSRLQGYRMGVDDFVPKGIAADELMIRLRAVLARRSRPNREGASLGLRGDLGNVRLGSLLAFLDQERRTGRLFLQSGPDEVTLEIIDGAVSRADDMSHFARLEDRVFALLDWSDGEFEFVAAAREELAASEQPPISVTYLLMEHARRTDEAMAD